MAVSAPGTVPQVSIGWLFGWSDRPFKNNKSVPARAIAPTKARKASKRTRSHADSATTMPIDSGKALEWLASDGRKGSLSVSRSTQPKLSLTRGAYLVDVTAISHRKVAEWKDREEKPKDKSKHKHKSKAVKPKSTHAPSVKAAPPSVPVNAPAPVPDDVLAALCAKLNLVPQQQQVADTPVDGGSYGRILQASSNDAPDVGAAPAPAPAPTPAAPTAPAAAAATADSDNPLDLTAAQDAELIRLKTENENWKDIATALGKDGKDISHIKNRFNKIKPADWRPNAQGKKGNNKGKNKGQQQEAKQEEKKEEDNAWGGLGGIFGGGEDADAGGGYGGADVPAWGQDGNANANNNGPGGNGWNGPGGNADNIWGAAAAANDAWNAGGGGVDGWDNNGNAYNKIASNNNKNNNNNNKNNNNNNNNQNKWNWDTGNQQQSSGSKKAPSHSGKKSHKSGPRGDEGNGGWGGPNGGANIGGGAGDGWGGGGSGGNGGGDDNRSVSSAPSYRDMYPDETFSLEDIVLISRLLKRDDAHLFFRLSCAFRDKTGRHVDEDVFKKKILGEPKGKGSGSGSKKGTVRDV